MKKKEELLREELLREEEVLESLEGKTDDEKKEILKENFKMYYDMLECGCIHEGPCKTWHAKVFTYCNLWEFQLELWCFLKIINCLAYYFDFCFKEEDTVSLGCTCPCGNKQVILYFSITYGD